MKLPSDWKELIASLSSRRVRFLVVGAHALAVHGRPRATGDLDIFVEPTEVNAHRLGEALADFGFPALARDAHRFAAPDRMATLGREPLRIDIMTSISGVSFEEAWKGRKRARFAGRVVPILGLRELVENKRASGRSKDLLDVAMLEEAGLVPARPRGRAGSRRRV